MLPSPWKGAGKHFVLLGLTALSVYSVGGLRLMAAVLGIMLAHEMGHYVACRIHGVDATLPFFIPFPLHLVGTFGAFIRIRSPFPNRTALFDIGIAGPLAGFAVCLPVLVAGVYEAEIVPSVPSAFALELGEPLLFSWIAGALRGDEMGAGMTLSLGPLGLAGWFGLLLTALNMMPIGQLDGGHVTYAFLRRHALLVSRIGFALALVLVYLRPTWLFWAILLFVLARPHPPTLDDEAPLRPFRGAVGLLGVFVFVVSFTPNPILVSWPDFIKGFRELAALVF